MDHLFIKISYIYKLLLYLSKSKIYKLLNSSSTTVVFMNRFVYDDS